MSETKAVPLRLSVTGDGDILMSVDGTKCKFTDLDQFRKLIDRGYELLSEAEKRRPIQVETSE